MFRSPHRKRTAPHPIAPTAARSTAARTRGYAALLALAAVVPAPALLAQSAPYDLAGPALLIDVTRGGRTLPLDQVPDLMPGDRLQIRPGMLDDQRAKFLLVTAFLDSATNPSPDDWIQDHKTWRGDEPIILEVPEGAHQLLLFMVPDTRGAKGAIGKAVQGKPGEFLRAAKAIRQASLDQSLLERFVAAAQQQEAADPAALQAVLPVVARNLTINLDANCLKSLSRKEAPCLTDGQRTVTLDNVQQRSLSETLIGAPTDLAMQLSRTREAGYGFYSSYIAVVRDVARVFGLFNDPDLRYLPALAKQDGERLTLQLNSAPSFAKPKSVMVTALPGIGEPSSPRFQTNAPQLLCASDPDLVLPVDGEPLIYSTHYAHDMTLQLADGAAIPVAAQVEKGGYVPTQALARLPADSASGTSVDARLTGAWGFAPLEGPRYILQFGDDSAWASSDRQDLVTGRTNQIDLTGSSPACVSAVMMQSGPGPAQPVSWSVKNAQSITVDVPLAAKAVGPVTLTVASHGGTAPRTVSLEAFDRATEVSKLLIYAGDGDATLVGQRLERVQSVMVGQRLLQPGSLRRENGVDMLALQLDSASGKAVPAQGTAVVNFATGRKVSLPYRLAPSLPKLTLVDSEIAAAAAPPEWPLRFTDAATLSDRDRMTFSLAINGGRQFGPDDSIEVATASGDASIRLTEQQGARLQSPDILVGSFEASRLGASAYGPLTVRLVREGSDAADGLVTDWAPLTTLVRLPSIEQFSCDGQGDRTCTLSGAGLYLIDAIASGPDFTDSIAVPSGFAGSSIATGRPRGGKLYLRMRDAPESIAVLTVP